MASHFQISLSRTPEFMELAEPGTPPPVAPPPPVPEVPAVPAELPLEEAQQLLDELQLSIGDLQTMHRQSLQEMQQVAVELAAAAASWLTRAAIDRDQFNLEGLIREAVQQLAGQPEITVRLNPQDLELWTKLQEKAARPDPDFDNVRFVPDAALARGDCSADAPHISLVTDLETRLADVRRVWLENLDDAQTERRASDEEGWGPGRFPDRRETA